MNSNHWKAHGRLLVPLVALALPVAAQEPAGIGVTRDGIKSFLVEEGFDSPYFIEDYPLYEGEVRTSAHALPGIDIDLYGPDDALTYLEATFRVTDDPKGQYWQGLMVITILTMAFPEWVSMEQWIEQALLSRGSKLARRGREVEVAVRGPTVYLIVEAVADNQ